MVPRRLQRTAPRLMRSIRPTTTGPPAKRIVRTAAALMVLPGNTATALLSVRPQMATNTHQPMATPTAILAAAGAETQTTPRNTTAQVLLPRPRATVRSRNAQLIGLRRQRRRDGSPDRTALAVRPAWAAAEAGADVDETQCSLAPRTDSRVGRFQQQKFREISYVT